VTPDQMDDHEEPVPCPICDGEAGEMGSLGRRKHYQCRACGAQFSSEERCGRCNGSKKEPWRDTLPVGSAPPCGTCKGTGRAPSGEPGRPKPTDCTCDNEQGCLIHGAKVEGV
jgi:hypothetical protein